MCAMLNGQSKVAVNGTTRNRGVRILAKSIFKELTAQGYDSRQIVSLATELISEVTQDLSEGPE